MIAEQLKEYGEVSREMVLNSRMVRIALGSPAPAGEETSVTLNPDWVALENKPHLVPAICVEGCFNEIKVGPRPDKQ